MDGLILSDFTELFYAVIVFGILVGVWSTIIGSISENGMDIIIKKEIQKHINTLDYHRMKEENEEVYEYNLEENNLAFM